MGGGGGERKEERWKAEKEGRKKCIGCFLCLSLEKVGRKMCQVMVESAPQPHPLLHPCLSGLERRQN